MRGRENLTQYQNCIFDLYGTLVDIHADEASPRLWMRMAEVYRRKGAFYQPGELREAYIRLVGNDGTCDIESARTVGLFTIYIRSNLSRRTMCWAPWICGRRTVFRVRRSCSP